MTTQPVRGASRCYPAGPLLDYIDTHPGTIEGWSENWPARARQISRAREAGSIVIRAADEICCQLGVHIGAIWDEYWDET